MDGGVSGGTWLLFFVGYAVVILTPIIGAVVALCYYIWGMP